MSIIEALRTFISGYAGLTDGAPVWVNYLGPSATEYSIVPASGGKIIEQYLDGGSVREFPFAFQSVESTADDLARLENAGFYEAFSDWLDAMTLAGNLPSLGAGKTATGITADGWGFLFEQGESDNGIYQINAKLTYEQAPA